MAELKLDLAVDSRAAVKGVKVFGDALDDVVDDLEKVAKESGDTENDLVKDLRKIADEAEKTGKAVSHVGDDVGGGTKRGLDKSSENIGEFKDEAKQNFGEIASSFSGSMDSAADLVQGTLGGLAASMSGPIGLALGAASIALGAFIADAEKQAQLAEDRRVKAFEAVKSALDAGQSVADFIAGTEQVSEAILALEETKEGNEHGWFWEDDPSRLKEWTDALDDVGGSAKDVGKIIGGSVGDLEDYRRAVDKSKDSIDEKIESLENEQEISGKNNGDAIRKLYEQADAYDVIAKNVDEQLEIKRDAAEQEKRLNDTGVSDLNDRAEAEAQVADAAEAAKDRIVATRQSVADEAEGAYDRIRDAAADAATSEDGVFNLDQWLGIVEQSRSAADQYAANLQSMKLTPDQWENLLALPDEARASIVNSYSVADPDTQARITAGLTSAGSQGGSDAAVAFDESFNPEGDATVEVTLEGGSKVSADISAIASKPYAATLKLKQDPASFAAASATLGRLESTRHATVVADASTYSAQQSLDRFVRDNTGRRIKFEAYIVDANGKQVMP